MTPMTCDQVSEHIDLYAVGACAPGTAEAIGHHLHDCPACRELHDQATQLSDRLDWHFREQAGLDRLLSTLARESRPAHRPWLTLPAARRAFALAASVLVVLGLGVALRQPTPDSPAPGIVAWLEPAGRGGPKRGGHEMVPGVAESLALRDDAARHFPLEAEGPLSLVRLDLRLVLANPESRTLYLHPDDPRTALRLELRGPAVKKQWPGKGALTPALEPSRRVIPPGGTAELSLPWLVEGTRKAPRHLFWAEPGRYELVIRYEVPVSETPQGPGELRIFTSRPQTLVVGGR